MGAFRTVSIRGILGSRAILAVLAIVDRGAMEILPDETVSAIACTSLRLSGYDQQMILGLIRPSGGMQEADDSYESRP